MSWCAAWASNSFAVRYVLMCIICEVVMVLCHVKGLGVLGHVADRERIVAVMWFVMWCCCCDLAVMWFIVRSSWDGMVSITISHLKKQQE
jgi:hypothetical protein